MDARAIIDKYYSDNPPLHHLLLTHSTLVAEKAVSVALRHPELCCDIDFLREASLLHDIGIFLTHAPAIHCHGTEHYLRHGILGAELLRREGLPLHARVAERHTGTGLTAASIIAQHLPLEPVDLVPETVEEQVVCYADKFFSKTRPTEEKTPEQALRSLERFGPDGVEQMKAWLQRFG